MPGLMFVQVNIKKSLCDRWPRILNESNPNLVSSDAWYLNIVFTVHGPPSTWSILHLSPYYVKKKGTSSQILELK